MESCVEYQEKRKGMRDSGPAASHGSRRRPQEETTSTSRPTLPPRRSRTTAPFGEHVCEGEMEERRGVGRAGAPPRHELGALALEPAIPRQFRMLTRMPSKTWGIARIPGGHACGTRATPFLWHPSPSSHQCTLVVVKV